MLQRAAPGATLLLNCHHPPDRVWDALSRPVQEQLLAKRIELYVIDAGKIAREAGLAGRTNTVLQTCFFAISGVLGADARDSGRQAVDRRHLRGARRGGRAAQPRRGRPGARRACTGWRSRRARPRRGEPAPLVPDDAPPFVREVTATMMAGHGDQLPVSALPVDGTYPSGTTRYEKRNISDLVAVWDPELCIQCGNCSFVCPHSVIRSRYYDSDRLGDAPAGFRSAPLNAPGLPDTSYTLQVYLEDCTGCGLCVEACPVSGGADPVRQAINLDAARAAAGRGAREHRVLRAAARGRPRHGSTSARSAARSSWTRCSSSRAPAPAAARPRT